MKLNPAAFNRHLAHIGQRVLWRRSHACPCITRHSGAANPSCPLCSGNGRVWDSPVECISGVSQQNVNPKFADFGTFEQGDLTMTIPSDSPVYDAGRFDRVTLLNSTDVFSRTMVRGDNDNLSDLTVQSVSRVFWIAAGVIVSGGIPSVSSSGVLTWASGAPANGAQYSITGTKFADYFIYDMLPSDRNEHSGAALPKRATLKRFDLFGK